MPGWKIAIRLTFVIAVGWVACYWPARWLNGVAGVGWMTLAAVGCLVPGWFVAILSGLAIFRNEVAAMLLQTMFRLGVVGVLALVVRALRPELGIREFYGWLVVFYLLALATDTYLARGGSSRLKRVVAEKKS